MCIVFWQHAARQRRSAASSFAWLRCCCAGAALLLWLLLLWQGRTPMLMVLLLLVASIAGVWGAAPPTSQNHIWQRVTHESCEHVAAGKSCDTLLTQHGLEFAEFKKTLLELHNHEGYDTPAHLCATVEKEMTKLAPHAGETESEQKQFCAEHWQELYIEAKEQHLLRSKGRNQEV